jgi:hypothetical protein
MMSRMFKLKKLLRELGLMMDRHLVPELVADYVVRKTV